MTGSSFLAKQIKLLCAWKIPESYPDRRRSIVIQGFQGVFGTHKHVPIKGVKLYQEVPVLIVPKSCFIYRPKLDTTRFGELQTS